MSAIHDYDGGFRGLRSAAVVRLADLRLRQGRLEESAALLKNSETDSYAVRPLARLCLANGETDGAASILRRHVAAYGGSVLLAPELALLAEVHLAAGRLDDAAALGLKLNVLAAAVGLAQYRALAEYTLGLADLAAGRRRCPGTFGGGASVLRRGRATAGTGTQPARTRPDRWPSLGTGACRVRNPHSNKGLPAARRRLRRGRCRPATSQARTRLPHRCPAGRSPDSAGIRSPATRNRGTFQHPDRSAPVHQQADGGAPCRQHSGQTGTYHPRPGPGLRI